MRSPSNPNSTPVSGRRGIGGALREPLSLLVLLLVSLCAVTVLKPDGDCDVWARLAVGKWIVESGGVTLHDPFSYTPKKPEWIDHEWGTGVVYYGIASVAGQKGLLLLKALLLFGTLCFSYLRARLATGRAPSLIYHVFLAGALSFGFLATLRAQTFTFFLFSAWLYLLERARSGDWRGTWLIPVTGLVWANLHGGFLAGVGLIVLFAAGELLQRRSPLRFASLALVTGLTSLVNPYGLAYWSFLFEATSMDRATIVEWQPLDLAESGVLFLGFKLLLGLTLLALIVRAARRDLPDHATILLLVVTAILGLRVVKHATLFVIASAPFVWSWLSSQWEWVVRRAASRKPLGGLSPVLQGVYFAISRGALLFLTVGILVKVPMRVVLFDSFPVRAVDFIQQNQLQGNLLAPFNFSSYAIWRLYPRCKVAVDGRYETVYLDSTFQAVREFFAGAPGWSEFLDQLPHDIILSQRRNRFEANMAKRSDWAVAYEDARYRVYVRSAAQRDWPPLGVRAEEDPFSTADKPVFAQ